MNPLLGRQFNLKIVIKVELRPWEHLGQRRLNKTEVELREEETERVFQLISMPGEHRQGGRSSLVGASA